MVMVLDQIQFMDPISLMKILNDDMQMQVYFQWRIVEEILTGVSFSLHLKHVPILMENM